MSLDDPPSGNLRGTNSHSMKKKRTIKFKFNDDSAVRGISNPSIRRLARRAGVKRISSIIYDETRGCLQNYLSDVIKDSIIFMEYGRRKTVMASDVVNALKLRGNKLYGYGQ